ncbi:MAG: DUF4830 domain-containing protein [Clostridia bacterium]|nr:DUF4830 domain-containing protein [Clostridia bacterium]
MFVYSVKTSKGKIAALVLAIIAIAVAIITVIGSKTDSPVVTDSAVNHKAENAEQRAAFLSQFGWKFSQDPVEVSEVIIPSDFSAGYTEYAEMNKASGFDLEPYKGMRAKRWTYDILNYPGYENKTGYIQANILVYNGQVIGGDVCSLEQGGFMHSFEFPAQSPETVPATNP